jgi:hypothetical protein
VRVYRARRAALGPIVAVLLGLLAPAPGASASGTTTPGCRPTSHVVCLGRADGGHRVKVRLGQVVTVSLRGAGLEWSGLREVGPRLLRSKRSAHRRAGTVVVTYAVVAKGRTELRAHGAPHCAAGRACPQFILLWQVQIAVT